MGHPYYGSLLSMITLSVLASSSKGNASVVSCGETHLLVDAGVSCKRITLGLEECDLHPKQLKALLFTHEHGDHVYGLEQLDKRFELQIYCTRYMAQELRYKAPRATFTIVESGAKVQIGDLLVQSFAVNHDAIDPHGFVFESVVSGARLGYVTDTGCITAGMTGLLESLEGLYLESNYDVEMLQNSGRSMSLITRIANKWGHLSNEQAADFVRAVGHTGLQHLVLGHLSQDCNTPKKAQANMQACLDELGLHATQLHCAPAGHRLPSICIQKGFALSNF